MLFFAPDKALKNAVCQDLSEREKMAFFGKGPAQNAAKKICNKCPIQEECLKKALEFEEGLNDDFAIGVWGGLSGSERNELRRKIELKVA